MDTPTRTEAGARLGWPEATATRATPKDALVSTWQAEVVLGIGMDYVDIAQDCLDHLS